MSLDEREERFRARRLAMVEEQIRARGVRCARVLAAMAEVPRHLFVPPSLRDEAYGDHALPIGGGQTISQPYIVAVMSELLALTGDETVLEVGTGSGYQTAILSRLARRVLSVELRADLARQAAELLRGLGCSNVSVRVGDGRHGWIEEAPFSAILVAAAPREVPQPLLDQLAVGGRMVIPLGSFAQDLYLVRRTHPGSRGLRMETRMAVRFVPLVG